MTSGWGYGYASCGAWRLSLGSSRRREMARINRLVGMAAPTPQIEPASTASVSSLIQSDSTMMPMATATMKAIPVLK